MSSGRTMARRVAHTPPESSSRPEAAERRGRGQLRRGLPAPAVTALLIPMVLMGAGVALPADDAFALLGERWPWRIFDRQEELPSSSVHTLRQDKFDNIYAALEGGVYRYDLWEWTRLETSEPFSDGPVRCFVESTGSLYAVTAHVLWQVQGGTALVPIARGSELHAAATPQGEVFLVDVGAGAHLQIRGEAVERIDPEVQIPPGRVLDYEVDAGRGHWLATSEGLFAREMSRRAWRAVRDRELPPALQGRSCARFFRVQGPAPRGDSFPPSAIPYAWDELWAVFESSGEGPPASIIARLEKGRWRDLATIEGPPVTGVVSDAQRRYYLTLEDGRLRVSRDGRSWRTIQDLGIGKVAIYAEISDSAGNLWFRVGTGGLAAFDPQSRRWEAIATGSDQSYPNVLSLVETEEGDVWMGMTRGLAWNRRGAPPETYESVHGVALRSITGLGEDTLRRIWVSSGEAFNGALCFNESIWTRETVPGFSDHPVRRIVRDRAGELWFLSQEETSTGEHRIYRCSVYTSYNILPVTIAQGPVNDLVRTGSAAAPRDVFWLATDEGLLRGTMDGETFQVETRYTEDTGLRSRRVFSVAEGPDGSIWVCYPGSSAGVTRLKGETVSHFDERDGLASAEVWSISASGGNVWFGTDRGLSRYDGECWYKYLVASSDPRTSRVLSVFPSVSESDSVLLGSWGLGAFRFRLEDRLRPRRPRFTRLRLPQEMREGSTALFSWDARDFRNDTPPDALLYRSRIDGEPWTGFSTTRFRQVTGLSPGQHVFEVEVRDLDGHRNREEVVHRFTVRGRGPGPAAWIIASAVAGLSLSLLSLHLVRRARASAARRAVQRSFFQRHPIPFVIVDGRGNLVATGGISPEMLGVDREGLAQSIGKPIHLLPLFMTKDLRQAVRELLRGEPFWARECRWTPDGIKERILEVRGFPLRTAGRGGGVAASAVQKESEGGAAHGDGAVTGAPSVRLVVIFIEDRTLRSEEEHLQDKTRRMQSLRNLADRIVGRAGGLLQDPRLRELAGSDPRLLERIRETEGVLSTLAEFAGSEADSSVWTLVSINEILESLVGESGGDPSIRSRLSPSVRVDYRGQPGLWSVRGDPRRLRAVLVEIVENAAESMPERGTLTIRTSNVRLEHDPGQLSPGAYVAVEVRDTGPGMDPGQLEQVLEPFFSTKPRDRAVGAGLSTAYGIVRSHGGDLRIESRPGQGTVVRVLLPARRM